MALSRTLLVAVAIAGLPAISSAQPSTPYESHGACPFECCTYRTWTVEADTEILAQRKEGSRVAFRVSRGSRVQGVTGVVVTSKLGRALVRRPTTIGTGPSSITLAPGDPVFVLHYVGEGYWKVWARGKVVDEQLPDKEGGCVADDNQPIDCALQITEEPDAVWWAKIRSRGREGWTKQLDHFANIDACG